MRNKETTMTTSELANSLDLGVTTIRKYAQYLEKQGYDFKKSNKNARLFSNEDVKIITEIKSQRETSNVTVQQAVQIVLKKFGKKIFNNDSNVKHENVLSEINELKDLLIKQHQMFEELKERIDTYEEAMNQRLNERDKALMREINERLEAQKLIAATSEEEVVPNENKTFFRKIFKKND